MEGPVNRVFGARFAKDLDSNVVDTSSVAGHFDNKSGVTRVNRPQSTSSSQGSGKLVASMHVPRVTSMTSKKRKMTTTK